MKIGDGKMNLNENGESIVEISEELFIGNT